MLKVSQCIICVFAFFILYGVYCTGPFLTIYVGGAKDPPPPPLAPPRMDFGPPLSCHVVTLARSMK